MATTDFRRLAIVNRGEAALRCLHAVAELNEGRGPRLTAIALYTDPDRQAWFVRQADEAIHLGPATFLDPVDGSRKVTYLDHDLLLDRLVAAHAEAVWVGWGFVAEHAEFARRCEEAGIVFVGPPSSVIRRLGDKIAAKRLAESVDVPVVPWSGGPVDDIEIALKAAEALGYPVALKASAGGGGRGIRMIRGPEELPLAFESARAEAQHGFGDPTLFLEQRVGAARHIEVQAIGDRHGTVWAVGLRDCTVQRRNQKVLEESSSTALDAQREAEIKAAAVRLCRAAGYVNAGTVEFLYDPTADRYLFMEVNTRLQVEHPVTELTTGVDLVKLQLHVARGGRLEGEPPRATGHAIEARLNAEDPEQCFAPAPGRVVAWRPPSGPGVRVETGVTQGDDIAPEFDSMIAKLLAYGCDRDEALARLRRALAETMVVVDGGMTNKSFLLHLLDREEIGAGTFDTAWLDRLTAAGEHLPHHTGLALLYAAVEAYEQDRDAQQAHFLAQAARGRPEAPPELGHRVALRLHGQVYAFVVYRWGPQRYRLAVDGRLLDVQISHVGEFERRLRIGSDVHRVVAHARGPLLQVETDGVQHRVHRDEGGLVRADAPALVVSVAVQPGDDVAVGDALVVLESMKMERTLTAPFPGRVRAVAVQPHVQVDPGAPLIELDPVADSDAITTPARGRIDFSEVPAVQRPADTGTRLELTFTALRSALLGYDLDPVTLRGLPDELAALERDLSPDDPRLDAAEVEVLDLFTDLAALSRRTPAPAHADLAGLGASQEHLLTYLTWLDVERSRVPPPFVARLSRALSRYGVSSLDRAPALEEALFWMYRSFVRLEQLAPAIVAILERRLRRPSSADATDALRGLLDRLVAAAGGRHPAVGDVARELRFRIFDEPVMDRARAAVYAQMGALIDEFDGAPGPARRADIIAALVRCHQPMRALLRDRYRAGGAAVRAGVLETNLRRFYRIRTLHDVRTTQETGWLLGVAEYPHNGHRFHLITAYGDVNDLEGILSAAAAYAGQDHDREPIVVGLSLWRAGERLGTDDLSRAIRERLTAAWQGPPLHRVDVTVTTEGDHAEHFRTQHVTFRHRDGTFVEECVYRNLHPMIAKRLELWRLRNFTITRLRSVEDVYVFHAVARDNPKDERLFALAEIRDLTPVLDDAGRIVALPHAERMLLEAFDAIRHAQAHRPARERLLLNRVILYIRPEWSVPPDVWRTLGHRLAPAAIGLGLQKVVARVRLPVAATGGTRDAVLHVENVAARGVSVRVEPPGEAPIRTLTEYGQKVLKARRMGVPYPYELLKLLTPPPGTPSDFPAGDFVEHDLVAPDDNRLAPVPRPPGGNAAGIVVGIIRNATQKVPEGMQRVAILGDPTRSLGSLAEPECRRIIGALDLAERMGVPVEWFALSSGARISMTSGTENMDWIGAVLRRIIEFTQAGGEINVVVTGINVGAQPYWNAEATMLMHTRGILVMTPTSAMVLTGKQSLDYSGGVSAEDNVGIGGYERIMGPNAQAQYWAPTLEEACALLFRHYAHTYVVPGERFPRRAVTADPVDRDVRTAVHAAVEGTSFERVGDIFSAEHNAERKHAFDIRSVLRAVADADQEPLERWQRWQDAETAVVWDAHVGGYPVALLGIESRNLPRQGMVPADGPPAWTSGTLFPQSSRKVARAINAASGNRPVVVLANLSGFDGSPESMRTLQLEFGAEIGRAVTNFDGPMIFVVISRYHGGAFVVFSKTLNPQLEIAAVEGSYASVIGGAPAAGVVFAREVTARAQADARVVAIREAVAAGTATRADAERVFADVRTSKLGEMAEEFDRVHSIQRALQVGSVDCIIAACDLRPYVIAAIERGIARTRHRGSAGVVEPAV